MSSAVPSALTSAAIPPPRKKLVRRVLKPNASSAAAAGTVTQPAGSAAPSAAGASNAHTAASASGAVGASSGGPAAAARRLGTGGAPRSVRPGASSSSAAAALSNQPIHRAQSSMAALITSAHEEVEYGLEVVPSLPQLARRERERERREAGGQTRPMDASSLRRLAVIAAYSPYAVSLPVLLCELSGQNRFTEASRSFWGVVLFCDISGFTKLAEALALGNEPQQQQQHEGAQNNRTQQQQQQGNNGGYGSARGSLNNGNQSSSSANSGQEHRRWLQRAGADTLVTIINQIFSKLVSTIISHNGDVVKFAGDALLAVWRPEGGEELASKQRCACVAAKAALAISAAMNGFEAHGVKMSVHSGLACGQLVELHLGGFKSRWEYLLAGHPIHLMGKALDVSKGGDVVAHGSVWELIHDRCTGVIIDNGTSPPGPAAAATATAAATNVASAIPNPAPRVPSVSAIPQPSAAAASAASSPSSLASCLVRLVSVHISVSLSYNVLEDLTHFSGPRSSLRAEDALVSYIPEPAMALMAVGASVGTKSQLITGELRQVTILFISLPDFDYLSVDSLKRNQNAVVIIQQVLYRFDGVMRQLIQDDKGTVCIVAFGLPYSTHEDDPLRGVLTAIVVKKNLEAQLGMRCCIGVTTGDAFCGVVGNEDTRCEYAIVGDAVNLSARLMGHAAKIYNIHSATAAKEAAAAAAAAAGAGQTAGSNAAGAQAASSVGAADDASSPASDPSSLIGSGIGGGILCDGDTESHISQSHDSSHGIHFTSQGRIPVKGRRHEVALFSPLFTDQAQSIGKPDLLMFGRRSELASISLRMESLKDQHAGGVIVIEGEAGMGKTRILQEVVANINAQVFGGQQQQQQQQQAQHQAQAQQEQEAKQHAELVAAASAALGGGSDDDKLHDHSHSPVHRQRSFSGAGLASGSLSHRLADLHGSEGLGLPSTVRILFGSGNSMTSKIAYSIWRNILPGLLTELIEGKMAMMPHAATAAAAGHHEESQLHAGAMSARGPLTARDRLQAPMAADSDGSAKPSRRSTGTDQIVMVGTRGVVRIASAPRGRRPAPTAGGGGASARGANPDPLDAHSAAVAQAASAQQHSKSLISETLVAAGLVPDEFCLINRFFPQNPLLQYPVSARISKLKPSLIARKIGKLIQSLLVLHYEEFGNPILLILDNIQWLDGMSWRVVDRLTRKVIPGVAILLTTRPASFSQSLKAILSRSHTSYIKLEGLDQRDIEGLCCLRLKVPSMPRSMAEMITKASNGNPLFVQELLLSLQQTSQTNPQDDMATKDEADSTDSPGRAKKPNGRRPSISQQNSISTVNKPGAVGRQPTRSVMLSNNRHHKSSISGSMDFDNMSPMARRASITANAGGGGGGASAAPSGYSSSINALFSVTASMQQIMTSRIDKLTPRQQDILKAASVIGMEFSSKLVALVLKHYHPAIIEKELLRMDTMGFIVIRLEGHGAAGAVSAAHSAANAGSAQGDTGSSALLSNDVMGGFRHAVMQDVTYKLLSKADRSALHLRVAEALELLENSREALRFLPYFTTLGLFMLPAWMDDGAGLPGSAAGGGSGADPQELYGVVDEDGNLLVEVDENGEIILDERGMPIPIPGAAEAVAAAQMAIAEEAQQRADEAQQNQQMRVSAAEMVASERALTPRLAGSVQLHPQPPILLPSSSSARRVPLALSIQVPPAFDPDSSTSPPAMLPGAPALGPAGAGASAPVMVATPVTEVHSGNSAAMGMPNGPAATSAAADASAAGGSTHTAPSVDQIPDLAELVERAGAAKDLAYHFSMAGVVLKALVYWDLASAIFLTMQEAGEAKKLMSLAVSAAVTLAPIKHVRLFNGRAEGAASLLPPTSASVSASPSPRGHDHSVSIAPGTIVSKSGRHSSAAVLLNALGSPAPSSTTPISTAPPSPSLSANGSALSSQNANAASSSPSNTAGSLRLCDALCLAKWERRLGESCRLLEDEDAAHTHLLAALKHLQIVLPSPDTSLLNPQNASSQSSLSQGFLQPGAEGCFDRVSFLTEVASVLLILSQIHYTSRPHEPLVGMHSSFLCLQAAEKAGHVGMMAAAYADLLLGCLSLGDLELVSIYYTLASTLVTTVRSVNTGAPGAPAVPSPDASSGEMAKLLSALAAVNLSFGRWTDANTTWMESYQFSRKFGYTFHVQECIQGLALLHRLSGHLSLSSALYARLQHLSQHHQHATCAYFLPRAMLGLIENLVLSGANDAAHVALRFLLLKGEQLEEEMAVAAHPNAGHTGAGGATGHLGHKERSLSNRPPSQRFRMLSGGAGGGGGEPSKSNRDHGSHGASHVVPWLQWSSQPEIFYRWKAMWLLLRWEDEAAAAGTNEPIREAIAADAVALLTAVGTIPDPKPAWFGVPRPAYHQLEAASALTQILCTRYFEQCKANQLHAHAAKHGKTAAKPRTSLSPGANTPTGSRTKEPRGSGTGNTLAVPPPRKTHRSMDSGGTPSVTGSLDHAGGFTDLAQQKKRAHHSPSQPHVRSKKSMERALAVSLTHANLAFLHLKRLADKLPIGKARLLIWQGVLAYAPGKVTASMSLWLDACALAKELALPRCVGMAQYWLSQVEVIAAPWWSCWRWFVPAKSRKTAGAPSEEWRAKHRAEAVQVFSEFGFGMRALGLAAPAHQQQHIISQGLLANQTAAVPAKVAGPDASIANVHSADGSGGAATVAGTTHQHLRVPTGDDHGESLQESNKTDPQRPNSQALLLPGDEDDERHRRIRSDASSPLHQMRRAASAHPMEEDDGSDSDPDSISLREPASPGVNPVFRGRTRPQPPALKYAFSSQNVLGSAPASAAPQHSDDEDAPDGGRAEARRRRAARAGGLPRTHSRHASINLAGVSRALGQTLRAVAAPAANVIAASSSDSDDEHKATIGALNATSPHMHPAHAHTHSGGPARASNSAIFNEDGTLASIGSGAPDGDVAVTLTAVGHSTSLAVSHSTVAPAAGPANSGGGGGGLSSMFLSPAASSKSLEAFRHEVMAMHGGIPRIPSVSSAAATAAPTTITLSLADSGGSTPAKSVAGTPMLSRRGSKKNILAPDSDQDGGTSGGSTLLVPHGMLSVTSNSNTPSATPPAMHSRRNSLTYKSLMAAAAGGQHAGAPNSSAAVNSASNNHTALVAAAQSAYSLSSGWHFATGDIFVQQTPPRGLVAMLATIDLHTAPGGQAISTTGQQQGESEQLLTVVSPTNKSAGSAQYPLLAPSNAALNFVPKQVLFRFLCREHSQSSNSSFLSSQTSEPFDAVVLALRFQLGDRDNEDNVRADSAWSALQFRRLCFFMHVVLTCAQQFDARLLNPLNSHTLCLMWETNHAATGGHQRAQSQHAASGLADACLKAKACAHAIKLRLLAAAASSAASAAAASVNSSSGRHNFTFSVNGVPAAAASADLGAGASMMDRVHVRYAISAGQLMVVDCPGVQQSVRQYIVLGLMLAQLLAAFDAHTEDLAHASTDPHANVPTSPISAAAVAKGVAGSAVARPIVPALSAPTAANHEMLFLGLAASILGSTDTADSQQGGRSSSHPAPDTLTGVQIGGANHGGAPAGGYELNLPMQGMQPITEDPESSRNGSHSTPSHTAVRRQLSHLETPPLLASPSGVKRMDSGYDQLSLEASSTAASAFDRQKSVADVPQSPAAGMRGLRPGLTELEAVEASADAAPRLTNMMVLQRIGQFCDSSLLQRTFALYVPRLPASLAFGSESTPTSPLNSLQTPAAAAALRTQLVSPSNAASNFGASVPCDVSCLVAQFNFHTLDEMAARMERGRAGVAADAAAAAANTAALNSTGGANSTLNATSTFGDYDAAEVHRSFAGHLNTLIQVLRYLLTLFPGTHMKLESAGTSVRCVIVMEQTSVMILSLAIRLLSAFQDARISSRTYSPAATGGDNGSIAAGLGLAPSPALLGSSFGVPVSCCIGVGTGTAMISGLNSATCPEGAGQWIIVGPAIERAKRACQFSVLLHSAQEKIRAAHEAAQREHDLNSSVTLDAFQSTPFSASASGGANGGFAAAATAAAAASSAASPAAALAALDNTYRILLCDVTYDLCAGSIVVERVESALLLEAADQQQVQQDPDLMHAPNSSRGRPADQTTGAAKGAEANGGAPMPAWTTGPSTFRLIRLRHASQYKLAQTSLCGRWKELQLLMHLLPTLDRIPRVAESAAERMLGAGAGPHATTMYSPPEGSGSSRQEASEGGGEHARGSSPGAFVLLTGESGVGKTHLMTAFRQLAVRTVRDRIFTIRLNTADQSTPWVCLRSIVTSILDTEAKALGGGAAAAGLERPPSHSHSASLSQQPTLAQSSAKTQLCQLFQQSIQNNLGGQTMELLPYLACLNALLPAACTFPESRASKQLSSGDRAEFTLTLLTYFLVFLLEPRPFLVLIHAGEFIDSLSWLGIKRISQSFAKSFFLVSAGAISAMDRTNNAGPMLRNLTHYQRAHQAAAASNSGGADGQPPLRQPSLSTSARLGSAKHKLIGSGAKSDRSNAKEASPRVGSIAEKGAGSLSLAEFQYHEINLRNLSALEIPSVLMNYLGLVVVDSMFCAFMSRSTMGHPQLLIHSLELMLSHGSIQDPFDQVVYNLDHLMFGYANAAALASALSTAAVDKSPSRSPGLKAKGGRPTSALGLGMGLSGGMGSVLGMQDAAKRGLTEGVPRPAQISMNDLTQERLNALSSSQRLMLRVASVIGAAFDARILRTIHPGNLAENGQGALASYLSPRDGNQVGSAALAASIQATPWLTTLYLSGQNMLAPSFDINFRRGGTSGAGALHAGGAANNNVAAKTGYGYNPPAPQHSSFLNDESDDEGEGGDTLQSLLPSSSGPVPGGYGSSFDSQGFESALSSDLTHLVALDLIHESGDSSSNSSGGIGVNATSSFFPLASYRASARGPGPQATAGTSACYVFSSSTIRELVYAGMDKAERIRLHTLVAKFYEREANQQLAQQQTMQNSLFYARNQTARATKLGAGAESTADRDDALSLSRDNLLAYHWRQAGDKVKQFTYTLSSARKSLRMHANREATQLYTQAIALRKLLLERHSDEPPPLHASTLGGGWSNTGAVLRGFRDLRGDEPVLSSQEATEDDTDSPEMAGLNRRAEREEQRAAAEAITSGRRRAALIDESEALDPLEVLHFEISSAYRNLSQYSRSNRHLMQVLQHLQVPIPAHMGGAASVIPEATRTERHSPSPLPSSPGSNMDSFASGIGGSPVIDIITPGAAGSSTGALGVSPAQSAYFLEALQGLESPTPNPSPSCGPRDKAGALLEPGHPGWLLAAKSLEKLGENCLRTREAQLGFYCTIECVRLYQSMEDAALQTEAERAEEEEGMDVGAGGWGGMSGASAGPVGSIGDASAQPAAYGLLSVYAAAFGFADYEQRYMAHAKHLFLNPQSLSWDAQDTQSMAAAAVNQSHQWNVRVTLSNYESSFLIGCGLLEDALNLLIDMQLGAADTFLGGHRSHRDLLFSIGVLFFLQGDFGQTNMALEDVLALARAHKDAGVESQCLNLIAYIHVLTDQPFEAMEVLQRSASLHSSGGQGDSEAGPGAGPAHGRPHLERNVLCHILTALAQLRVVVAPPGAVDSESANAGGAPLSSLEGNIQQYSGMLGGASKSSVGGGRGSVIGTGALGSSGSSAVGGDSSLNVSLQRSLDSIYQSQRSIDSVFSIYSRRMPLMWHDCIEHMAMAAYLMELLCWLGSVIHLSGRKDGGPAPTVAHGGGANATGAGAGAAAASSMAGGIFSSSALHSSFAPLSDSEQTQLRSLHTVALVRLRVVHGFLRTFAQRFQWAACIEKIVAGALIMIEADDSGYAAETAAATAASAAAASPSHSRNGSREAAEEAAPAPAAPSSSPLPLPSSAFSSSRPLSRALDCWQSAMQLATDHHMTHYLAHAHYLFGVFLRVQDPARRIHLQTARAIFIANGCAHYANLSATALCHLSYFDLGVPLQNRLSPFTAYSYALVLLHAEKASNFMLLTPTKLGMASKGILRRQTQDTTNNNTAAAAAAAAASHEDKHKTRSNTGQQARAGVHSSSSSLAHVSLTAPLSLDSTTLHPAPASPTGGGGAGTGVVRKAGSHRMTGSSAVGAGHSSTAPVSRAGSTKELTALLSAASSTAAAPQPSEASSNSSSSATVTAAATGQASTEAQAGAAKSNADAKDAILSPSQ